MDQPDNNQEDHQNFKRRHFIAGFGATPLILGRNTSPPRWGNTESRSGEGESTKQEERDEDLEILHLLPKPGTFGGHGSVRGIGHDLEQQLMWHLHWEGALHLRRNDAGFHHYRQTKTEPEWSLRVGVIGLPGWRSQLPDVPDASKFFASARAHNRTVDAIRALSKNILENRAGASMFTDGREEVGRSDVGETISAPNYIEGFDHPVELGKGDMWDNRLSNRFRLEEIGVDFALYVHAYGDILLTIVAGKRSDGTGMNEAAKLGWHGIEAVQRRMAQASE